MSVSRMVRKRRGEDRHPPSWVLVKIKREGSVLRAHLLSDSQRFSSIHSRKSSVSKYGISDARFLHSRICHKGLGMSEFRCREDLGGPRIAVRQDQLGVRWIAAVAGYRAPKGAALHGYLGLIYLPSHPHRDVSTFVLQVESTQP